MQPDNLSADTSGPPDDPREAGAAYLRQGRFDEAAQSLARATTQNPDDENAWRLLGGAYASQGDYARAVEAFRRAVTLLPLSAKNHYNLGVALQGADDTTEARAAFEKALALDPGYEQARTRLDALSVSATPANPVQTATAGASLVAPAGTSDSGVTAYPNPPSSFGAGLGVVGGSGAAPLSADPPPTTPAYSNDGLSSVGTLGGTAHLRDTPPTAPPPYQPNIYGAPGGYGAPTPQLGMGYGDAVNTSGMQSTVPAEVSQGWNWGAFVISWIWALNHKMVAWGIGIFLISFVPYLGGLAHLAAAIYLGAKGNDLAWQNRRFESVADFKACQAIWAKWGIGLLLLNIVFAIIGFLIFGAALLSGAGNSRHTP